jgi:hypothetical protein
MSETHTVGGTIRRTDGSPAAWIDLVVVDADAGLDDALGHTETHGDGRFTVEYDADEAGGAFEGTPELYAHGFADGEKVGQWELTPGGTDHELTLSASADSGPSLAEMMDGASHHGMGDHRGMSNVPRDPPHPGRGRFGRLFPYLEPADHDERFLQELGLPGGPLDESVADEPVQNATLPAGFVFLGQFIDHDITLDPLSSLSRRNDPAALRNFRTPRLDLDSVYGAGPEADRFRYANPMPGEERERLLLGAGDHFLPRNHEDTALIADPRNDENLILSQFQYAMLRFHNAVLDREDVGFERAQQLARWHYQWLVLNEYLPAVCDEDVVEAVREERRYYTVDAGDEAYMPLEFAGAAYRFGHSQARFEYRVNDDVEGALFGPPSDPDALGPGFVPVPPEKEVDWAFLFDMDGPVTPQPAREIDPRLARDLLELPFVDADEAWRESLASRNLVRGLQLGLPSGQTVARAIEGAPVLHNEDVGFDETLARFGQPADTEMPLWYYVLAEARHHSDGEHLGPVGSRIVAEVLVGLVDSDTSSFRTVQPGWTPTLPAPHSGADEFSTADLLDYALSED